MKKLYEECGVAWVIGATAFATVLAGLMVGGLIFLWVTQ